LTSQQPMNNAMRVALQAMAAALGGCQSLHTNSYDEALALPSEEAARIALRTQQILAFETGVADTVDPVAGSYAVEALTDEIEARVWKTIERVRGMGGMLPAIAKGVVQGEIQESAYRYQKDVESGRRRIVGVNCWQAEEKSGKRRGVLKVSPKLETDQKRRLAAFRSSRDSRAAAAALKTLSAAAKDPARNLFVPILECVESGATLGEVCGALREVFGEHHGS
jgi:methylmalonyl-CoA mutase, N-terminal domain